MRLYKKTFKTSFWPKKLVGSAAVAYAQQFDLTVSRPDVRESITIEEALLLPIEEQQELERKTVPMAVGFTGFSVGTTAGGGWWVAWMEDGEVRTLDREPILHFGGKPYCGAQVPEWEPRIKALHEGGGILWEGSNSPPRTVRDFRNAARWDLDPNPVTVPLDGPPELIFDAMRKSAISTARWRRADGQAYTIRADGHGYALRPQGRPDEEVRSKDIRQLQRVAAGLMAPEDVTWS